MAAKFSYNVHVFRSPKFKGVVADAIRFFADSPVHELPPPTRFRGVGVYALYYLGDFDPYRAISKLNQKACTQPLYVGKAVPTGWRTGRAVTPGTQALHTRLREHSKSIKYTTNLREGDFRCRFMILRGIETDLVVPVEAQLIRTYKPLWNTLVDGFGNHDPGKGRYDQAPSEWDVLHPGRPWVNRLTGQAPRLENVLDKIRRFTAESLFP